MTPGEAFGSVQFHSKPLNVPRHIVCEAFANLVCSVCALGAAVILDEVPLHIKLSLWPTDAVYPHVSQER